MTNNLFSRKNKKGALILLFRAAFVICIFSGFLASHKRLIKKRKPADMPKVTQIDETNIAEILKPNDKPLLVNFWATWCVPCREEFPDLVKINEEFKGKINVITISLDDLAEINRDVPKFLIEMKATMPTYLLYTNKESEVISSISKDWQGGLPFSILYDGKGEVVHTKQGKIKLEVVKAKIQSLVSETSTNDYERGKIEARSDISSDKLIIKRVGYPANGFMAWKKILQKRYQIKVEWLGCGGEERSYAKGYNEVSEAEIKNRFGESILETTWKEARNEVSRNTK